MVALGCIQGFCRGPEIVRFPGSLDSGAYSCVCVCLAQSISPCPPSHPTVPSIIIYCLQCSMLLPFLFLPSSTPTSTTTELRIALFSFYSQPPIHPPTRNTSETPTSTSLLSSTLTQTLTTT